MLLSLSRNELFQTQFWNQNIVTTVYRTGARVESKKELESEPKWARLRNTIERRWTIIALRSLIFYFWSNIELTWHECSFMSQITTLKKKCRKIFLDLI